MPLLLSKPGKSGLGPKQEAKPLKIVVARPVEKEMQLPETFLTKEVQESSFPTTIFEEDFCDRAETEASTPNCVFDLPNNIQDFEDQEEKYLLCI